MKMLGLLILAAALFVLGWALSTAVFAVGLNGFGPYDFSFSTLEGFGFIGTVLGASATSQR